MRGFTLVDMAVALAIGATMATLAWPSYVSQLQRARRADGTVALQRLLAAQEQYRANHGTYAASLAPLRGAAADHSDGGHYRIALRDSAADGFVAEALPEAAQAGDRQCPTLRLRVEGARVLYEPSRTCWNL